MFHQGFDSVPLNIFEFTEHYSSLNIYSGRLHKKLLQEVSDPYGQNYNLYIQTWLACTNSSSGRTQKI
jgi:hypothetical protein